MIPPVTPAIETLFNKDIIKGVEERVTMYLRLQQDKLHEKKNGHSWGDYFPEISELEPFSYYRTTISEKKPRIEFLVDDLFCRVMETIRHNPEIRINPNPFWTQALKTSIEYDSFNEYKDDVLYGKKNPAASLIGTINILQDIHLLPDEVRNRVLDFNGTVFANISETLYRDENPGLYQIASRDIELAKQIADYFAIKYDMVPAYQPIARANQPMGQIEGYLRRFVPDLAQEYIEKIEDRFGDSIKMISRFQSCGSPAVYCIYGEERQQSVLKFTTRLEYEFHKLVSNTEMVSDKVPVLYEDTWLDLGNGFGCYFMEDISGKIVNAYSEDPVENIVRIIADLHYCQKKYNWKEGLEEFGLIKHDYPAPGDARRMLPALRAANKLCGGPESREKIDSIISTMLGQIDEYSQAYNYIQEDGVEWVVGHGDPMWKNTRKNMIFDFGNGAIYPMKDLSMFLGDEATQKRFAKGKTVMDYLAAYIDQRNKHSDDKYDMTLERLYATYHACAILDKFEYVIAATTVDLGKPKTLAMAEPMTLSLLHELDSYRRNSEAIPGIGQGVVLYPN